MPQEREQHQEDYNPIEGLWVWYNSWTSPAIVRKVHLKIGPNDADSYDVVVIANDSKSFDEKFKQPLEKLWQMKPTTDHAVLKRIEKAQSYWATEQHNIAVKNASKAKRAEKRQEQASLQDPNPLQSTAVSSTTVSNTKKTVGSQSYRHTTNTSSASSAIVASATTVHSDLDENACPNIEKRNIAVNNASEANSAEKRQEQASLQDPNPLQSTTVSSTTVSNETVWLNIEAEKPTFASRAFGKETPLGTNLYTAVELGKQTLKTAVTQSKSKNKDTLLARGPLSSTEKATREEDRTNALTMVGKQKERESLSASMSAAHEFSARADRLRREEATRFEAWKVRDDSFRDASNAYSNTSKNQATVGSAVYDTGLGGFSGATFSRNGSVGAGASYGTSGRSVDAGTDYGTSGRSVGAGTGYGTAGSAHRGSTLQR